MCSTDSADHLFLVCAFVFASAIIDYNSYSFGECAICITYIHQTELAKKCISSACLYMCVYNSLADFPCVYICNGSKLLVQTRVLQYMHRHGVSALVTVIYYNYIGNLKYIIIIIM